MERTQARSEALGAIGRAVTALAVVAFVAACGPSGGVATNPPATSPPVTTTPAATTPPAAATSAPTSAAGGLTLEVATASAGDHVAGEGGKSLYIFTPDSGNTSACTGDCASNWPPFVVDDIADVTAGTGVTGALATITRDDGSLQVTLGGSPLYYFAGDSAAGDTNGQGVGDVWYLAAPDGSGIDAPTSGYGRNY